MGKSELLSLLTEKYQKSDYRWNRQLISPTKQLPIVFVFVFIHPLPISFRQHAFLTKFHPSTTLRTVTNRKNTLWETWWTFRQTI